jgi:hypothetical protein
MSDDELLSRLDRLRAVNQDIIKQRGKGRESEEKDAERRYKFRQARKIYKEVNKGPDEYKHFTGGGITHEIDKANYFLGISPRNVLGSDAAEKYFGERYTREHVHNEYPNGRNYPPNFLWDKEGEKKVTNEEIGKYRGEIQALAHTLINSGHPDNMIVGAKLYAKLGKGRKIVPKLLKQVELAQKAGWGFNDRNLLYIKHLIKNREKERQPKEGGLEGRALAFIGSIFAGIALSVFSLTSTGNAIGNLTGTSQGLLGLILFVVGIAGLVFSKR